MPIAHDLRLQPATYEEFHALDYQVMALVFSAHRESGRLWEEKIYQNDITERCEKIGLVHATEVPVSVSYKTFTKRYFLDLVLNNSVLYELKAANALTGDHEKQTLNYLLLLGLNHGKLINMRPPSVQHRFVSTRLSSAQRWNYVIHDENWMDLDRDSTEFKQLLLELLAEWGTFLDVDLFSEAVVHFRGGEDSVIKRIEVSNGSKILGTQRVHLLNDLTAFKLTAITKESSYEQHLRRFLSLTQLKAIQWVNFNHQRIEFRTILSTKIAQPNSFAPNSFAQSAS